MQEKRLKMMKFRRFPLILLYSQRTVCYTIVGF